MFFFHGFGLSGKIFYELEEFFQEEYTIYNFDLPFHGQTRWRPGEEQISAEFWEELLERFCREKAITSFSLLAYSIGARLAWASVLSFPGRVKEVMVIAPDGIKNSIWYSFATQSSPSRKVFKMLMSRGSGIHPFLKAGRFLRLVPRTTARFAESQLVTAEQRERVYYTWVTFRNLKADIAKLSSVINEYHIPLTIYLGTKDRIITSSTIQPLVEKLEQKNVVLLEAGHSNLVGKVAEYLKKEKR